MHCGRDDAHKDTNKRTELIKLALIFYSGCKISSRNAKI